MKILKEMWEFAVIDAERNFIIVIFFHLSCSIFSIFWIIGLFEINDAII